MSPRSCLAIILAAGEGTRMKSDLPKVLHRVAGQSMVGHAITAAARAGGEALAVVVGPGREDVASVARTLAPQASIHVQTDRLGTGHAILQARDAIARGFDDVLVAFGDTPLVTAETFGKLRAALAGGAAVAVAGFETQRPTGYGRLVMEAGRLVRIVEEKDATPEERRITLCNGGLMGLAGRLALDLLARIRNDNAKGEFYQTDVVGIAAGLGLPTAHVVVQEDDVRGVNDRAQLAEVEALMQARLRSVALAGGCTMVAPETVFLSHDTVIGRDVTIEPHVVLGPGVVLADRSTIRAFSHIEGARVGGGAIVGPFARLRPRTVIGEEVHIGNFVEVNRSVLERDVQANHLAYIGDATVGANSNIGAGTITCNFDGADKHQTVIGKDVFVGSNATLVAPLVLGDAVLVAAGSVVTKDVPGGAMVFGRAAQVEKPGRGAGRIAENKVKRAARKAKGG